MGEHRQDREQLCQHLEPEDESLRCSCPAENLRRHLGPKSLSETLWCSEHSPPTVRTIVQDVLGDALGQPPVSRTSGPGQGNVRVGIQNEDWYLFRLQGYANWSKFWEKGVDLLQASAQLLA